MRAVVQRVVRAQVTPGGSIGAGLCVLLGVSADDGEDAAVRLAGRVARLRTFEDEGGKFDRSLLDTGGAALVVSQFTLIADTRKGNRPSFDEAARPDHFSAGAYASAAVADVPDRFRNHDVVQVTTYTS